MNLAREDVKHLHTYLSTAQYVSSCCRMIVGTSNLSLETVDTFSVTSFSVMFKVNVSGCPNISRSFIIDGLLKCINLKAGVTLTVDSEGITVGTNDKIMWATDPGKQYYIESRFPCIEDEQRFTKIQFQYVDLLQIVINMCIVNSFTNWSLDEHGSLQISSEMECGKIRINKKINSLSLPVSKVSSSYIIKFVKLAFNLVKKYTTIDCYFSKSSNCVMVIPVGGFTMTLYPVDGFVKSFYTFGNVH